MAVETGADLAGFFDADEFAVAATFTPSGGSGVAVTVIWETGRDVEETAAGWVNRTWRRVRVRQSEIAEPAAGDTLTISGTDYRVQGAELDDGVWTVGLR